MNFMMIKENGMITSKQRAYLRGLASKLDPIIQIGHKEVSDNMLMQIDGALETRELIKLSILQNSDADGKILAAELSSILEAEVVSVIGRKIVLYRRSKKKGVKHIELI